MLCVMCTQNTIKMQSHFMYFMLAGRGVSRRIAGLDAARFLEIITTRPERIFLIALPADTDRIEALRAAASAARESVENWLFDIVEGTLSGRRLPWRRQWRRCRLSLLTSSHFT